MYLLIGLLGMYQGGALFIGFMRHHADATLIEVLVRSAMAMAILSAHLLAIHVIEWIRDRSSGKVSVNIGHFVGMKDLVTTPECQTWKDEFLLTRVTLERPKYRKRTVKVICSGCGLVEVEIWSHWTALINKLVIVIAYYLYFIALLSEIEFMRILCIFPGLIMAISGISWLLFPWGRTSSGVGSSVFLFLGISKAKSFGHRVFEHPVE